MKALQKLMAAAAALVPRMTGAPFMMTKMILVLPQEAVNRLKVVESEILRLCSVHNGICKDLKNISFIC